MQNQVALGAQRSPSPVKGSIARGSWLAQTWRWTGCIILIWWSEAISSPVSCQEEKIALDNQYRI
jgi:hypothetical protein